MSTFDDKIKDIANKEFQQSTGVPPEMLRGMAAKAEQQAAAFASRRLAQAVKEDKPDLTIKSTITNLGKGGGLGGVETAIGNGTGSVPEDAPTTPTDNVEFTIAGASYTASVVLTHLTPV